MVTELASCVQFQGRVTIYFLRCRSSYVLRRSLPTFPVFSNLSDLSQKESIKERQNIEVKRTKTKSLVAQTSVTKKKKKKKKVTLLYFCTFLYFCTSVLLYFCTSVLLYFCEAIGRVEVFTIFHFATRKFTIFHDFSRFFT